MGISERRLHIGGKIAREGWEIFDIVPRDNVDHIGNAIDLSQFEENTFTELYASHALEHFDLANEVDIVLAEWFRVLTPSGRVYIGVPDLDVIARMLTQNKLPLNDQFNVLRMLCGGQTDEYDFHKIGFNFEFLSKFLEKAGFINCKKVSGIFSRVTTISPFSAKKIPPWSKLKSPGSACAYGIERLCNMTRFIFIANHFPTNQNN